MKLIISCFFALLCGQLAGQSFWKLHGSETDRLARHSGVMYNPDMDAVFVSTYNMGIFRSIDLGLSWQNVLLLPKDQPVTAMAISPKGTLLGGGIGKIYRSGPKGDKWEEIPLNFTVIKSIVHDTAGNLYLCSADSGGIMKSNDDGLTWKLFTEGLPSNYVNNLMVDNKGNMFCSLVIDRSGENGGLFYWNEEQQSWVKREVKVILDNIAYSVKISSIWSMAFTPAGEIAISVDGVITNFEFRGLLKNALPGIHSETIWKQERWNDTTNYEFNLLLTNVFYTTGGHAFGSRLSGVSPGIYAKMKYAPKWFLCNEGIVPMSLVKSYFFEKDGIVYVTSDYSNTIYRTNETLPGKKYADISVHPLKPMKLFGYQELTATSPIGSVRYKSMDSKTSIEGSQLRATNTGTAVIKAFTEGNDSVYYSETLFTVDIAKAENKITVEPLPDYTDGDTAIYIAALASSGEPVQLRVISGNATFDKNKLIYNTPGKIVFIATERGNNSYEQADTVRMSLCINPKKPNILADTILGKVSLRSSTQNDNKWYRDGAFFSSGAVISEPLPGLYTLRTETGGCSSAYSEPYNYIISALKDLSGNKFTVYPNPFLHNLTIDNPEQQPFEFAVSDISGRVLNKGSSKNSDISMDFNQYTSGTYLLTLFSGKRTFFYKLVKK